MIYIGQSSRTLHSRITSHRSDNNNINKQQSSALAIHVNSTKHNVDYENTKILATEPIASKRLFLEMFYIQKQPNAMNKRSDISSLSNIYTYLIKNNFTVVVPDSSGSTDVSSDVGIVPHLIWIFLYLFLLTSQLFVCGRPLC